MSQGSDAPTASDTASLTFFHGTSVYFAQEIARSGSNENLLENIGAFALGEQIAIELSRIANVRRGNWLPSSAFPCATESDLLLVSNALWVDSSFQYGAFFATLNFEYAKDYAAHGSEYLRAIRAGLRLLGRAGASLLEGASSTLREPLLSPHEPAVVEINGLSRDRLYATKEAPSVAHTLQSYQKYKDDPGVRMPWAVRISKVDRVNVAKVTPLTRAPC